MSNQNYPNYPPGTPPYPGYPPAAPVGPGSFVEHLHTVGKSGLFLVGIILFTAGTLLTLIASFSIFTIFPLLLAALPITGFWLIFAASKSPKLPEKTLPALTLFKVYAIIGLVIVGLGALITLIGFVFAFIGVGAAGGGAGFVAVFLAFLLVAAIFVVAILFYYVAIIRVLNSIRDNITHNTMNPLRGVTPLTVVIIIITAFGLLGSLIGLVFMGAMGFMLDAFMDELVRELMWTAPELLDFGIVGMLEGLLTSMTLTLLFSIITYVGTILLIVSLNKLAGVVKR